MKIAIIGASSFIGHHLYQNLPRYFKGDVQIIGTYCKTPKPNLTHQLDITSPSSIRHFMTSEVPDVILWVAGEKDLKKTEQDLSYARKINTNPIKDLLENIPPNHKPLIIYFSTDYVFDGIDGSYKDTDKPNPTTNYGLSNYEAEQLLISHYPNTIILRTSAVMGKGGTFFDFLITGLKNKDKLELFQNILFTPTPILAIVENIPNIITANYTPKILHLSGNQIMSRYDFGILIQSLIDGQGGGGNITSITPSIFQKSDTNFFAPNLSLIPSNCFLDSLQEYKNNPLKWLEL